MAEQTEIDLEIVVDGVTVRGHASISGFIKVHMTEPFDHESEYHYGFFRHPPKSNGGKIAKAKLMLENDYRFLAAEKAQHVAERATKDAAEWAEEAEKAHRDIVALQHRIRQIRKITLGTAKHDLQTRKISQKEYIGIRDAYRSSVKVDVKKINILIANRRKFLQYAEECRLGPLRDKST